MDQNHRVFDGLDVGTFIEAMHDETIILDADGVIIAVNTAWRQFCIENGGDATDCYLGSNYLGICRGASGPSSAEAGLIPDGLECTLRTGDPFKCEYPCHSPTTKRWFELTASRLLHRGARYLIVQHRNITTRHVQREEVEKAFIQSSAVAALVATSNDAIISYDLDGNIITWNPAAQQLYGYTSDEAIGQSMEILYPEGWSKRITQYRDEILAGTLASFEAPRMAKSGAERLVWISCAPIRSASGEVVAVSNIHRDVTEIRKAEKAREVIAYEVIHRAKNMLGIVSSIQRQTARRASTLEGFLAAFDARIQSLARSTDLLVGSAWTKVGLRELVLRHLDPFALPDDPRLSVDGPDVDLTPQSVQTIGMALHELATNSVKHGALKINDGRIAIRWSLETDSEAGPELHFLWREIGEEVVAPDAKAKGFGSTVLTSLAPSMLSAPARYDLGPEGVSWRIRVPAEHFSRVD